MRQRALEVTGLLIGILLGPIGNSFDLPITAKTAMLVFGCLTAVLCSTVLLRHRRNEGRGVESSSLYSPPKSAPERPRSRGHARRVGARRRLRWPLYEPRDGMGHIGVALVVVLILTATAWRLSELTSVMAHQQVKAALIGDPMVTENRGIIVTSKRVIVSDTRAVFELSVDNKTNSDIRIQKKAECRLLDSEQRTLTQEDCDVPKAGFLTRYRLVEAGRGENIRLVFKSDEAAKPAFAAFQLMELRSLHSPRTLVDVIVKLKVATTELPK